MPPPRRGACTGPLLDCQAPLAAARAKRSSAADAARGLDPATRAQTATGLSGLDSRFGKSRHWRGPTRLEGSTACCGTLNLAAGRTAGRSGTKLARRGSWVVGGRWTPTLADIRRRRRPELTVYPTMWHARKCSAACGRPPSGPRHSIGACGGRLQRAALAFLAGQRGSWTGAAPRSHGSRRKSVRTWAATLERESAIARFASASERRVRYARET